MPVEEAAKQLTELGMNVGSSGNVSVRTPENGGFRITGSGKDKTAVQVPGDGTPSSEWRMHFAIYKERPDVCAIVHCHSTYATAVACTGLSIPPFHYQVAGASRGARRIPCIPYYKFGSQELANEVAETLVLSNACLLGNHGLVAIGESLAKAIALAIEVEWLAKVYMIARGVGVVLLTDEQFNEAVKDYGRYIS